jgi:MFS family permease
MEKDTSELGRIGYWRLVRTNRDFRFLWSGQIVSLFGDWFNLIASATLVSSLTHSGIAVGLLFIIRMLAPFCVSPLAGVVADRYDRRKVLIVADVARGVIVFGFLLVRDAGHVWLLFGLTALQLGISGFFFPARTALLPNIVRRKELGAANALSSVTWSVMLAFGTALGGVVASSFGVYTAFVLDALSFFLSAVLIAGIRYRRKPEQCETGGWCVDVALRQYVEGLQYLRKHLGVLAIVMNKAALTLTTSGALQVIQVALAERVFAIGEEGGVGLGIMFAVVGVGTGVGPIVARRFTGDRDRPLRIAIGIAFFMTAAGVAIAATLGSFSRLLLGLFLRGMGGGIVWVFSTQLMMQRVPNEIQGRIFATEFALFTLMGGVSAGFSGWAIDTHLGLSGTLWWMAVICLIPSILWIAFILKKNTPTGLPDPKTRERSISSRP